MIHTEGKKEGEDELKDRRQRERGYREEDNREL